MRHTLLRLGLGAGAAAAVAVLLAWVFQAWLAPAALFRLLGALSLCG